MNEDDDDDDGSHVRAICVLNWLRMNVLLRWGERLTATTRQIRNQSYVKIM
jgi:hypothetical protein